MRDDDIDPRRLDPVDRYSIGSRGLLPMERILAYVLTCLGAEPCEMERTRDPAEVRVGGEHGVVLFLTPDRAEARLPRVEWTLGSHGPALTSVRFRSLRAKDASEESLSRLIAEARRSREKQLRPCRDCGKLFQPQRIDARSICHGCGERSRGIVH